MGIVLLQGLENNIQLRRSVRVWRKMNEKNKEEKGVVLVD
jgi:hypothetical protein